MQNPDRTTPRSKHWRFAEVRIGRFSILLLSVFGAAGVNAEESHWDNFQIHGFASQGAVNTSDNRFFGDSPQTSFDFIEVGVNASLQFNPSVLLSAQLLSRHTGDLYDGTPALDYALADITLASSMTRTLGLRVGRIKNPLGLYNETRDVPFTHPGIFLPQVVYYDKVRNLMLASDGLMLYGQLYGDAGNVSVTLGGGQAVIDENVEWTYLGNDFDGDLEPNGATGLVSLWYTTRDDRLKLGLSGAMLSMQFDPGSHSPLNAGATDLIYWIASIQYNAEDWSLSAEYAREPLEWLGYGPFIPDRKGTGEGYYLQGVYRVRPDLELMLSYQEGFSDRNDRDGTRQSALTGGFSPPFNSFSKIWSAGLRWDIDRHWMVRAEYQWHHGTFILSPRENPDPSQLQEDWSLFAVQAAFRF